MQEKKKRRWTKRQIRHFEQFAKQWPEEWLRHGGDNAATREYAFVAALGCLGFTFTEDIAILKEYLYEYHPDICAQITN